MSQTNTERIRVGVADMAVTEEGIPLATSGLGSCVAVAIRAGEDVGGLLHAMLPAAPDEVETAAKYVDSGIEEMLRSIDALGGDRATYTAKVTGGSSMLDLANGSPVGEENVTAALTLLEETGIDIAGSETGGDAGRSVVFDPSTGSLRIQRVHEEETII
ncbi:MAG: chemotaxis protein CheD [Halanaeroarchaeum sp.]